MRTRWAFLIFAATLFVAAAANAQVTTGTIIGSVTDSSGVVPGATVTVREVNKGTTSTYVTDETGTYTAPFLVPGTYAVEVNVQGFKKSIREGIILQNRYAGPRRRDARSRTAGGNDDRRVCSRRPSSGPTRPRLAP